MLEIRWILHFNEVNVKAFVEQMGQKVPKFELYKHNDELFNIYYGFFMNFELLPILTDYAN